MANLIALPTTSCILLRDVVVPALGTVLQHQMNSPEAQVMLLAIAGQESGLAYRRQMENGPARGLWEFEKNGIYGVVQALPDAVMSICLNAGIKPNVLDIYTALETDDILACRLARLLLYSDHHTLPPLESMQAAWVTYLRNWKPGLPDRTRWTHWYNSAVDAVSADSES